MLSGPNTNSLAVGFYLFGIIYRKRHNISHRVNAICDYLDALTVRNRDGTYDWTRNKPIEE